MENLAGVPAGWPACVLLLRTPDGGVPVVPRAGGQIRSLWKREKLPRKHQLVFTLFSNQGLFWCLSLREVCLTLTPLRFQVELWRREDVRGGVLCGGHRL